MHLLYLPLLKVVPFGTRRIDGTTHRSIFVFPGSIHGFPGLTRSRRLNFHTADDLGQQHSVHSHNRFPTFFHTPPSASFDIPLATYRRAYFYQ